MSNMFRHENSHYDSMNGWNNDNLGVGNASYAVEKPDAELRVILPASGGLIYRGAHFCQ